MAVPKLKAEIREVVGTTDARHRRKEGMVPGVLYGQGEETRNVLVPVKELQKIIYEHGENTMITLQLGGEKVATYLQEIQKDVVDQSILHADFYHLVAGKKVRIKIPIFIHHQEELKKDEVLIRQRLNNLEVYVLPADIMESIDLDAREISMHDPVTVADLNIPESVEPLHELDEFVAVAYSSRYTETEEDELEGEEEVLEPVFDTGSDDEE